jgi:hypothetical protein
MVYTYKFKFNYSNININKRIKYIHCPEHILYVHKFIKLTHVEQPIYNYIRYNCNTFGKELNVLQYSINKYHSELLFKKNISNNEDFNLPYLKLKFNIKPYNNNKSYILYISLIFWNPIFLFIVPLLPTLILINCLKNKLFLEKDYYIKEHPMFRDYRKNIL